MRGICLDLRNSEKQEGLDFKVYKTVRHTEVCDMHSSVSPTKAYSPFEDPIEYHESIARVRVS